MSAFPSACVLSVAPCPLNWGAGSTPMPCSGGSPGSDPTPHHCKFPKWTRVLLLGGASLSTAGIAGGQARREFAVCLPGGCSESPKDTCMRGYLHAGHTCQSFPMHYWQVLFSLSLWPLHTCFTPTLCTKKEVLCAPSVSKVNDPSGRNPSMAHFM